MIVTVYTTTARDKDDNGGTNISEMVYEVTDTDLGFLLVHKQISVEIRNADGFIVQRHNLKLSRRGR